MTESFAEPSPDRPGPPPWPKTIVIQQKSFGWLAALLLVLLIMSGMLNLVLLVAVAVEADESSKPREVYVSGDRTSPAKIALVEVSGTITPPFTERWLRTIEAIADDEAVKGVVLRIDSPGGLVADSHQIYHALNKLREETGLPIYVSMARIAASGGYYIAMGAGPEGRIFAEPTTWTGSIGVIMPRYNVSELAAKVGVESEPLVTGKFKDSLSPLRNLSEDERKLWEAILDDAFSQFKQVVLAGRAGLDEQQLEELAQGQVFTARQASENGLVDEIGFQDDAISALAEKLGLEDPKVVRYEHPLSFMELLTGAARAQPDPFPWQELFAAKVPQVLYYCGFPGIGPLE